MLLRYNRRITDSDKEANLKGSQEVTLELGPKMMSRLFRGQGGMYNPGRKICKENILNKPVL